MRKGEDIQFIREYLLCSLDESAQEQIEERLLSDEVLQKELAEAQHDLIDDYIFGLLTDRERELFERNFALNEERLHLIRLAEALLKYTDANDNIIQTSPSAWKKAQSFVKNHKFATAACVAVVVISIGYGAWTIYHQQLKDSLQTQRRIVEQELARLNAGQILDQRATITIVTLRPLLRDLGEITQAAGIATTTDFLQLKLELTDDRYPTYRAIIETSEGVEMYKLENLKTRASDGGVEIVINLPGHLLSAGQYQIHLVGISSEGRALDYGMYPFKVVNHS